MRSLELEIKALIVDSLGLEDVRPEEIDSDEPLFYDGLGLDSIDAIELELALRRSYGLGEKFNGVDITKHFVCVRSLADFLRSQCLSHRTVCDGVSETVGSVDGTKRGPA